MKKVIYRIIFEYHYRTNLWNAIKYAKYTMGKKIKFYKEKKGGYFYDKNKIWFVLPEDKQIYSIKNNKLHKPNPWFTCDPLIDYSKEVNI